MVTLEIALAVPLVVVAAVVAAVVLAAGHTQARVTDAARAAARELARGGSVAAAQRAARGAGGDEVELSMQRGADLIRVTAQQELTMPGPLLARLTRTVSATVTTAPEQVP